MATKIFAFPKASGEGIQVDTLSPTFPWQDIIGMTRIDITGVAAPVLGAWRGGSTRQLFYGAGDKIDMLYHIPHDYLPSSDIHLHCHWGHHGTAISGSLVLTYAMTYAKGHNQSNYPAETTTTLTVSTPNIATIPQYRHRVDEVQISNNGGDGTHIDRSVLEPDGILLVNMVATTIPTITGGATNKPCIFTLDVHYQSTGIGTKQKTPSFYT